MKPSLFVCLLSIFTILYSIHCENNFNDINADYDDDEDNSDSDESTNLFGGPKSSLEKKLINDDDAVKGIYLSWSNMDLCKDVTCKQDQECVVQSKESAICVDKPRSSDIVNVARALIGNKRKQNEERESDSLSLKKIAECKVCPSVARTNFYCATDNFTYSSLCRLRFHNCVHDLDVKVLCKGFCPCGSEANLPEKGKELKKHNRWNSEMDSFSKMRQTFGNSKLHSVTLHKDRNLNSVLIRGDPRNGDRRICNAAELKVTRERLIDWFGVILSEQKVAHKKVDTLTFPDCPTDTSNIFMRLDLNGDLKLSPKELFDLEYDNQEKCIKQYIDSCDGDKDGYITPYEWCTCFDQKVSKPCRVERNQRRRLYGEYVPKCDYEGYYRPLQCHSGYCWCVDKHGIELADTRRFGKVDCDMADKDLEARKEKEEKKLVDDADDENDDSRDGLGDEF